jgi:hypothetical protein
MPLGKCYGYWSRQHISDEIGQIVDYPTLTNQFIPATILVYQALVEAERLKAARWWREERLRRAKDHGTR